jgi:hypothetical protein
MDCILLTDSLWISAVYGSPPASGDDIETVIFAVKEGSRKYSKCHLNVLALADLPILPQRAVSQEIDSLLRHRMSPVMAPEARCPSTASAQSKALPTTYDFRR